MTLGRALVFIAIGTVLLSVMAGLVLVSLRADGTAFALALVLSLCVGGFANYLATAHYGAHKQRHH